MPRELLTIRVEPALRARLLAGARRRHLTPSAVVRLAIDAWLAEDAMQAASRPFEQIVDLLGCVAVGESAAAGSAAAAARGERGGSAVRTQGRGGAKPRKRARRGRR